MRKILVIEITDAGANDLAEAIKSLGYAPVFVCNLHMYQGDILKQLQNQEVLEIFDTSDPDEILRHLNNQDINDVAGVISLLDSRVMVAAQLAKYLNVPGNDLSVVHLCNKGEVQQLVSEFSPPTIRFKANDIPLSKLENLLSSFKKLVLKPASSSGGTGMFFISNFAEFSQLELIISEQFVSSEEWVAQAFIDGILISLEGFAENGATHFIGFTKRMKIQNTETIDLFPYDKNIKPEITVRAKNAVNQLVQQSNYKNGYFHTEFIMTENDCYLIDANFGRIGGGGIVHMIALAFNLTSADLYKHIILTTLFPKAAKMDFLSKKLTCKKVASIHYGVFEGCLLRKIIVPEKLGFTHMQLVENDAFVAPMGLSNLSIIGFIIGYEEAVALAIEQISIITNKGMTKPYFLDENRTALANYQTWDN